MKKIYFIFSFILILLYFVFYIFSEKRSLNYSFYFWETNYNIQNKTDKLYIKVADIKYSNKLEVIKTTFEKAPNTNFIPVLYITNLSLKKTSLKELSKVALEILSTTSYSFKEFQIDCDWSLSTKEKYFKLLRILKEKLNKKLSVTIRLHQIKYFTKTGVPDVDYGVLMYYNMSNIADFNTKNSILDNEIAKKYHYNFDKYPLKLKLALPLYSQAIQFRNEKALDIFEGIKKNDFDKKYFTLLSKNKYKVIKSTYLAGRYLYKGDILKFEDSYYDEIKVALEDFLKLTNSHFNEIIFYTYKYKSKYDLNKLLKE